MKKKIFAFVAIFLLILTTQAQEKIQKVKPKQPQVFTNLTVLSPNGGEAWEIGERYSIRWTSKGVQGNVKIMLKMPGHWYEIAQSVSVDAESYNYTVPENIPIGTKYRVYVMTPDEKIKDESNKYFSVTRREIRVLRPNGGEKLIQGTEYDIKWHSSGRIGNLKIDVEDERGVKHRVIETRDTKSYRWRVPTQLRPEKYKLIIFSQDGKIKDESNERFDITPPGVELTCGFLEYGKFTKSINVILASAKRSKFKFEVFVENKGTQILNRVPFMWTILKQPLNDVVVQAEAGFGNVYPNGGIRQLSNTSIIKKIECGFFQPQIKSLKKGTIYSCSKWIPGRSWESRNGLGKTTNVKRVLK